MLIGLLTDALTAGLVLAKVFCPCTAAFFLFRKRGNTFAESASYAIITVFMLLSFIHQVSFISGFYIISTGGEAFFLMVSVLLIFKHRSQILDIFNTLKSFGSANPISFTFLGLCLFYMAIHAILPVPKEFQNELYNIALYEKNGMRFL